jgi:hypothetical protein
MRDGFTREKADAGVVAAFGQVVADFQAVFPATEFARGSCREIIRKSEKDLRAECLEKRAP